MTLWTVACQTPLSIKFSRQEYWSGLPFPSLEDLPDPGIKTTSPSSSALTGRIWYFFKEQFVENGCFRMYFQSWTFFYLWKTSSGKNQPIDQREKNDKSKTTKVREEPLGAWSLFRLSWWGRFPVGNASVCVLAALERPGSLESSWREGSDSSLPCGLPSVTLPLSVTTQMVQLQLMHRVVAVVDGILALVKLTIMSVSTFISITHPNNLPKAI